MIKKKYIRDHKGNIAIIVAISLTVLIGMLAIVIDGGWLYASKNKYQNGVEAAALAGAIHLCDSDPIGVARAIAGENGIPSDPLSMQVVEGYYDEHDAYDDFSVYKDFTGEGDADYPDDEYNNAVMVSLNADVSTFLAGIFGKEEVAVSAKAVAYAQRYLMISLGEGDTTGITTGDGSGGASWPDGHYPSFHNGIVHSNNDIVFNTRGDCEGPEFVNSHAYAHGQIYTSDEGGQTPTDEFGESGVKEIEIPSIDWDELRAQAEANGKVIDMDYFETLPNEIIDRWGDLQGRWGTDEFGNCYTLNYVFGPAPDRTNFVPLHGDHEGRTYFFEDDVELIYMDFMRICSGCDYCCEGWPYSEPRTNMTMAAINGSINFYYTPLIIWGGDNAGDLVSFYSAGHIILGEYYDDDEWKSASDSGNEFAGAFLRAEKSFWFRQAAGTNPDFPIRKMRVIAKEQIYIHTVPSWWFGIGQTEYGFDANFGPPCPPIKVHLGKLEPPGT